MSTAKFVRCLQEQVVWVVLVPSRSQPKVDHLPLIVLKEVENKRYKLQKNK